MRWTMSLQRRRVEPRRGGGGGRSAPRRCRLPAGPAPGRAGDAGGRGLLQARGRRWRRRRRAAEQPATTSLRAGLGLAARAQVGEQGVRGRGSRRPGTAVSATARDPLRRRSGTAGGASLRTRVEGVPADSAPRLRAAVSSPVLGARPVRSLPARGWRRGAALLVVEALRLQADRGAGRASSSPARTSRQEAAPQAPPHAAARRVPRRRSSVTSCCRNSREAPANSDGLRAGARRRPAPARRGPSTSTSRKRTRSPASVTGPAWVGRSERRVVRPQRRGARSGASAALRERRDARVRGVSKSTIGHVEDRGHAARSARRRPSAGRRARAAGSGGRRCGAASACRPASGPPGLRPGPPPCPAAPLPVPRCGCAPAPRG